MGTKIKRQSYEFSKETFKIWKTPLNSRYNKYLRPASIQSLKTQLSVSTTFLICFETLIADGIMCVVVHVWPSLVRQPHNKHTAIYQCFTNNTTCTLAPPQADRCPCCLSVHQYPAGITWRIPAGPWATETWHGQQIGRGLFTQDHW